MYFWYFALSGRFYAIATNLEDSAKEILAINEQLHFTTRNIIETLQNMKVANFTDICYSSQYTGSQTLKALETCFHLGLDRKLFLPKDLNAIRRKKL